jgi:hypothetical protein
MNTKTLMTLIPAALLALACGKTAPAPENPDPVKPQETVKIPINIATAVTKVTDTGYEADDAIGLFVVNQPGDLLQSGNHADNAKFAYDGEKWAADNQLYWADDKTSADFYAYYPYSASATVDGHSFSVQQDQSTQDGYKASEFLAGSKKGVAPTPDPVLISTDHIMSCLRIELKAGTGWTDSDINAAGVVITGLQNNAKINLADGTVTADGNVADITPLPLGEGVYKALVVPQTVDNADLIKIKVGNNDYVLKTSVTFVSGKQHKCTIVIDRTSEGINISINPWKDGEEFGGTVN